MVVVVVVVDGVDGRVVVVTGAVVVVAGPVVVVTGAVVVVVGAVVVVAGAVLVVAGAVVVVVGAATAVDAVAGGRTLPPLFVGMLEVVEDPAPGAVGRRARPRPTRSEEQTCPDRQRPDDARGGAVVGPQAGAHSGSALTRRCSSCALLHPSQHRSPGPDASRMVILRASL